MLNKKIIKFIQNVEETISHKDFQAVFGSTQGAEMYEDFSENYEGRIIFYLDILRKSARRPLVKYINENFPKPVLEDEDFEF